MFRSKKISKSNNIESVIFDLILMHTCDFRQKRAVRDLWPMNFLHDEKKQEEDSKFKLNYVYILMKVYVDK